jgi:hypothetical protein
MRCIECGEEAGDDAKGWRAYRDVGEDIDEDAEIVFYCPECAAREFDSA